VHAPLTHVWFAQGTGVPHIAGLPLHVCTPLPEHCTCPAVHGPTHAPLKQLPLGHASGLPHCPQPPHVSICNTEHCATPGVHTGADAHEHPPHAHAGVHVCDP
jgi:hypothetical protein